MRLKKLFHAPDEIFEELDRELKRLSKQKRTRKTTLELIQYESGYLEYENKQLGGVAQVSLMRMGTTPDS